MWACKLVRKNLFGKFKIILCLAGFTSLIIAVANVPAKPGDPCLQRWQSGDILFLNGTSWRSRVVRLLQKYSSEYSHVGIVVMRNGIPFVVHADPIEGRVAMQRWDEIIGSGKFLGGALYRIQAAPEHTRTLACNIAQSYASKGIRFDSEFNMNERERLYCTELVLDAYRDAGLDLYKNAEREHPYLLPAALLNSKQVNRILQF